MSAQLRVALEGPQFGLEALSTALMTTDYTCFMNILSSQAGQPQAVTMDPQWHKASTFRITSTPRSSMSLSLMTQLDKPSSVATIQWVIITQRCQHPLRIQVQYTSSFATNTTLFLLANCV